MKMKQLLFISFITISILGCNSKIGCTYKQPINMNDGLRVSTLKKHNLDTAIFNRINQEIFSGKYGNIHSLLVIDNNELVIEQYYNGWKKEELHFLASNTKSFNAILISIAIEQGKIKNVNQKMLDFFPEYTALKNDTLKNKITIKNLLTNTSGLLWDEQSLPVKDPDNMGVKMDKRDDWLKSSLNLSMDTIPGTKYVYSGPNNIILSEIIKRATGKNIAKFAEKHLFNPIGIKEYSWYEKNGIHDGSGGLKLKSRDIAKYGLLHLNKGKWKENEIVSKRWIKEIFSPYIEIHYPFYSCYQWQMAKTNLGFNVWFIPGYGDQIINIIPALNMVIVINADNRDIEKEDRLPLEYLLKDIIKIKPRYNLGFK